MAALQRRFGMPETYIASRWNARDAASEDGTLIGLDKLTRDPGIAGLRSCRVTNAFEHVDSLKQQKRGFGNIECLDDRSFVLLRRLKKRRLQCPAIQVGLHSGFRTRPSGDQSSCRYFVYSCQCCWNVSTAPTCP